MDSNKDTLPDLNNKTEIGEIQNPVGDLVGAEIVTPGRLNALKDQYSEIFVLEIEQYDGAKFDLVFKRPEPRDAQKYWKALTNDPDGKIDLYVAAQQIAQDLLVFPSWETLRELFKRYPGLPMDLNGQFRVYLSSAKVNLKKV